MTFDTDRDGDGWTARCNDCHEVGRTDRLAQLGGWMAAHTCSPPRKAGDG